MAKPRSRPQLALDSACVWDTYDDIPPDDWCRVFYETIRSRLHDADYADLYEEGGRAPISPAILICITLLQYMHRVPDRQAVACTIRHRDWRIALGLGADWRGFCPTVLVRFRQRLRAHGQEQLVFETVLERLRELGLLANRHRVRIDATRVLANVERLSRADLVQEAIRVVVCALAKAAPELEARVDFAALCERYARAVWVGTGSVDPERLADLGRDAVALLALCGERELAGRAALEQILAENFTLTEGAAPAPLPESELAVGRIASPHEPDAHLGTKGAERWLGDKAHIVETADPGQPNFIVEAVSTEPKAEDSTMTQELIARARAVLPEVNTVLADTGYASTANSLAAEKDGVDLVAPARPACSSNAVKASEFDVDFTNRQARCPEGQSSTSWTEDEKRVRIRFPAKLCHACPRYGSCTKSAKQGRTLGFLADHAQLAKDRARMKTDEFKALYRTRAPIEATMSQLARRCGLRQSRYRGAPGRAFHVQCAAAALNIWRLAAAYAAGKVPAAGGATGAIEALCSRLQRLLQAATERHRAPRRPQRGPRSRPTPSPVRSAA